MSTLVLSGREAEARALWWLVALALPVSLALSVGVGLGLMNWVGCRHLSPTLGTGGGAIAVLLLGALTSSLVGNLLHARKSIALAEQASVEVDDEERVQDVARIAASFGVAPPTLRAVVLDAPLAFSVNGATPAIVVSTWVFDHLTRPEWQALLAHELAHLRHGDRLVRWLGCWLLGAVRFAPGSKAVWQRLEAATEDAADQAAASTVGHGDALRSARQKFLAAQEARDGGLELEKVLNPHPAAHQLALITLGLVAALPLVPLVAVPLCAAYCGR